VLVVGCTCEVQKCGGSGRSLRCVVTLVVSEQGLALVQILGPSANSRYLVRLLSNVPLAGKTHRRETIAIAIQ
jgi:hypothetical protein